MSEQQASLILQSLNEFKVENKEQHQQIIVRLDKTNGNVKDNTSWRLQFTGGFSVIKWLLGFVGIGNIIILFKLFN